MQLSNDIYLLYTIRNGDGRIVRVDSGTLYLDEFNVISVFGKDGTPALDGKTVKSWRLVALDKPMSQDVQADELAAFDNFAS